MSPLIKFKKGALKDTTRKINLSYKIKNMIVYNKFIWSTDVTFGLSGIKLDLFRTVSVRVS